MIVDLPVFHSDVRRVKTRMQHTAQAVEIRRRSDTVSLRSKKAKLFVAHSSVDGAVSRVENALVGFAFAGYSAVSHVKLCSPKKSTPLRLLLPVSYIDMLIQTPIEVIY